jgi:hypothetical protein
VEEGFAGAATSTSAATKAAAESSAVATALIEGSAHLQSAVAQQVEQLLTMECACQDTNEWVREKNSSLEGKFETLMKHTTSSVVKVRKELQGVVAEAALEMQEELRGRVGPLQARQTEDRVFFEAELKKVTNQMVGKLIETTQKSGQRLSKLEKGISQQLGALQAEVVDLRAELQASRQAGEESAALLARYGRRNSWLPCCHGITLCRITVRAVAAGPPHRYTCAVSHRMLPHAYDALVSRLSAHCFPRAKPGSIACGSHTLDVHVTGVRLVHGAPPWRKVNEYAVDVRTPSCTIHRVRV